MALKLIHSGVGVTLGQVKAKVGWDIKIALDFGDTEPPTEEELRIFRERIAPQRVQRQVGQPTVVDEDD